MDHTAQQNSFCLFVWFFPIILACKEICNGVFLYPPPAPYNWLNAREVIYFKEIIKGVKSLKKFFLLGFPGAPLRTQRTSCIRLRENKQRQVEKVLYSQISFTIYDRFYISCLKQELEKEMQFNTLREEVFRKRRGNYSLVILFLNSLFIFN